MSSQLFFHGVDVRLVRRKAHDNPTMFPGPFKNLEYEVGEIVHLARKLTALAEEKV